MTVTSSRAAWLVPTALIVLSVVPALGGAARLTDLTGGEVTPESARFFASPVPVVLHIFAVTTYSLLGAFQFAPGLRRRRPRWHRTAGRILVPCGLVAALTGLWMTVFYAHPPGDGTLLIGIRLVFGSAMFVSIVLGFAAVRRRDFATHRAWMMRGYAIALGAGTQALTLTLGSLVPMESAELRRALLMAAAWVINLIVAEWFIRTRISS
jgi:uncharacterized membrane protein